MEQVKFEQVTTKFFTEILPKNIMLGVNDDIAFEGLIEEGGDAVQEMIDILSRNSEVEVPYAGNGFSVGHAKEESLDLWIIRIHNEVPECATIRNFYILFQIEGRQAVRRQCYMSFETCGELMCGWFVQEGQVVLFKNEFKDEDDETDAIVKHYKKKYGINIDTII